MPFTHAQQEALDELRAIEAAIADRHTFVVTHVGQDPAANLVADMDLGGLALPRQHRPPPAGERVRVLIPPEYPYLAPEPWIRFPSDLMDVPHVLWDGLICLYDSASDWDGSDGMAGFLTRLESWFEHALDGTLDPLDQPLHPPLTSRSGNAGGQLVVWADAPRPAGAAPLLATAVLVHRGEGPADVVSWVEELPTVEELENLRWTAPDAQYFFAAAVMLRRPMSFRFPDTSEQLIEALERRGVRDDLVDHLADVAALNKVLREAAHRPEPWPQYLFVGSPADRMPTENGQPPRCHLAAWALDQTPRSGEVAWAVIYDQRPEMIVLRDEDSPLAWLRGKSVLLLGCGAVGAPIAQQCLRGGTARLTLVDNGRVSPGVLVRQPFRDTDIGRLKVYALSDQLLEIRPRAHVTPVPADVLALTAEPDWFAGVDLIVDATADRSVAQLLERLRWSGNRQWPSILTLGIGHRARRGLALLSPSSASGGGWDLLGRLALTARTNRALADVTADFFPPDPPPPFQPEPGCSAATFIGSATEVQALSSQLFEWGVHRLYSDDHAPEDSSGQMSAYVIRLSGQTPSAPSQLRWPNDLVLEQRLSDYQVRITAEALAVFRAEVDTAAFANPTAETGGLLFGRIDNAAMVIWITMAAGPPPDSLGSPQLFSLGTEGAAELSALVRRTSGDRVRFLGAWHTHPDGEPQQSEIDEEMAELLAATPGAHHRTLLIILGGRPVPLRDWLAGRGRPVITARLVKPSPVSPPPMRPPTPR